MKLPSINLPQMEANCEYYGYEFGEAQLRADATKATIYENNNERGWFLVLTPEQLARKWPLGVPTGWAHY